MSRVLPKISVMSDEQAARVHDYSLEILSTTGIRVESENARKIFRRMANITFDDTEDRAFIPSEVVRWALKTAPSTVDVFSQKGEFRFQLGNVEKNRTRFGVGVTNLYYQQPETDDVRSFTRKLMETSVRLGDVLSSFDIISTPGIIKDRPPETADLHAVLEMAVNTEKPLVVLISESRCFDDALDLLEHVRGPLAERPFAIPYFNPITPLVLNEETSDKMISTIERGLPFIYNNYGMSGATLPITPAGTLALSNAELLAGVVFSQLVKEGAAIIPGSLPAGFNMNNMKGVYTPRTMLLNLACAEMMAFYDLPHSGTSGSGPGWGPDLLAGDAFWLNHLTGCLGKVGMAPFVGGNLDSLAFSPAAVVYADHIIKESRLFEEGFTLNDEMTAVDEVDAIGPGGNFLASDLTFNLFRKFDGANEIWPDFSLDQWQTEGRPRVEDLLRKHTVELIHNLGAPEDHAELRARGDAFIRKCAL